MFDNVLSKLIKELQEKDICEELISDGNMSLLLIYIIIQFWRLPTNDNLVEQIIRGAYIGPLSQEINDKMADDIDEPKILRMEFFNYTLQHIESMSEKPKDYFIQLHEFEEDTFIIGDYPLVFKYQPEIFTDLALTDYVFALSSKRVLLYSLEPLKKFSFSMSHNYNVCIIENSDRYIASGNIKKLKESIDAYKYVKDAKWENQIKFELFDAY